MPDYSHEYDSIGYDPAAPVLDLGVAATGQGEPSVVIPALIDSGADATLLPIDVLQSEDRPQLEDFMHG